MKSGKDLQQKSWNTAKWSTCRIEWHDIGIETWNCPTEIIQLFATWHCIRAAVALQYSYLHQGLNLVGRSIWFWWTDRTSLDRDGRQVWGTYSELNSVFLAHTFWHLILKTWPPKPCDESGGGKMSRLDFIPTAPFNSPAWGINIHQHSNLWTNNQGLGDQVSRNKNRHKILS